MKYMKEQRELFKDTSALIIASGNADRLKPLNLEKPKCLFEFDDVPFLVSLIHWLRSQGVRNFFVTAQYNHSEMINGALKKYNLSQEVEIILEQSAINTVHSTHAGLTQIMSPTTFLVVADSIFELSLQNMFQVHRSKKALVTALVSDRPGLPNYPVSVSDEDWCITMCGDESNQHGVQSASTIGAYFVETKAFLHAIDLQNHTEINKEPMEALIPKVCAYWHTGIYYDYGTPEKLAWLTEHPKFIEQYYGKISK